MRNLIIVAVVFVSGLLSGCATSPTGGAASVTSSMGGHGGGFAVMKDGSYFNFDANGQGKLQCLLCGSSEGADACKVKAQSLGTTVCADSNKQGVTAAPKGGLTCAAYGPFGPLPPVPYGTAGYACYMTSPTSCVCYQGG